MLKEQYILAWLQDYRNLFEASAPVPANNTALHPDCYDGPTTCCPFVLQEDANPAGQ